MMTLSQARDYFGVREWGCSAPLAVRLLRRAIESDGGCWIRTRTGDISRYSSVRRINGKVTQGHRAMYEVMVGPIPEGLHLDHLCRRPACINPAHLEPVTPAENIRRGLRGVLRTHCQRGHELSEANTYPSQSQRKCITCNRTKPRPIRPERCDGIRTTNYQYGCRCAACLRADATMQAASRARRRANRAAA